MLEFKNEQLVKCEIDKLKKTTNIISIARLILAINTIIWCICLFSLEDYRFYSLLSIISFITMLLFILLTNKYYTRLELIKNKERAYNIHKRRRNLEFSGLLDTGSDLLNKDDYKQADLDIFGQKSLYQFITSAKTKSGRFKLAKELTNPEPKNQDYTKCVDLLSKNEDTLELESALLSFDNEARGIDYNELMMVSNHKIPFKSIFLIPIFMYLATIIYLILAIVNGYNLYITIILLIISFMCTRYFLNNDIFSLNATKYSNLCSSYLLISNKILELNIDNSYYAEIKQNIASQLNNLKTIKNIYNTLSSRKNFIANILLNMILLYDLWIIILYNKYTKKANELYKLIDSVASVEVLISLANIGMDLEYSCIPNNSDKISGEELYHPLVKKCVSNDFTLEGGVILTGSNMSGKTTFMRTLGINQILFNAGGLVCAKSYNSFYMPIYTSLRANDMLQEGISTFYAEILRMKKINEAITNDKCLILVDEIFKGTNAYERITASMHVIDKLNLNKALFIISTHDFELCDAKNILNYHFNEEYNDNQISFDYKVKSGKCESRNALYLLKMLNIIE
ncbi:MAG: hypothetical protein IJY14_01700 [Acholeplasmatales bacterium]|nr:hypothetical protein [Acholeplasmatales bacterium]